MYLTVPAAKYKTNILQNPSTNATIQLYLYDIYRNKKKLSRLFQEAKPHYRAVVLARSTGRPLGTPYHCRHAAIQAVFYGRRRPYERFWRAPDGLDPKIIPHN